MADDARASRIEKYRQTATALRFLAQQTKFSDGRARLLALAESFEKLADRVEDWRHTLAAAAD